MDDNPISSYFHLQNVFLVIMAVVAVVFLNLLVGIGRKKTGKNMVHRSLPPGPRSWLLVGNLGALGLRPHHDLTKLMKKYGKIIYLRLGSVPVVVICSPELAEEALRRQDPAFAFRPDSTQGKIMFYDNQDIAFSKYGGYWRYARKVVTQEVLTVQRLQEFQNARKDDILCTLFTVIAKSEGGRIVRLHTEFDRLVGNNMTHMMVGERFSKSGTGDRNPEDFKFAKIAHNFREMLRLFTVPDIGDFFPFLGKLDLQGYRKEMRQVRKVNDEFLEEIITNRRQNLKTDVKDKDVNAKDFVDVLLTCSKDENENSFTDDQLKAILLDMYAGSIEAIKSTLEWVLAELLKNPRAMRNVQDELDTVVGRERCVEESDLPQLPYLYAAVKETFRIHPVLPLIPRASSPDEDSELGGYLIPAKSRVLVNVWGMGRDPDVWADRTHEFLPERFLDSEIDLHGHHFQLLAFGAGRRNCPGKNLGVIMVNYTLAVLLHCCDFALPKGQTPENLDMEEVPGVNGAKAVPLETIVTPRMSLESVYRATFHGTE